MPLLCRSIPSVVGRPSSLGTVPRHTVTLSSLHPLDRQSPSASIRGSAFHRKGSEAQEELDGFLSLHPLTPGAIYLLPVHLEHNYACIFVCLFI